ALAHEARRGRGVVDRLSYVRLERDRDAEVGRDAGEPGDAFDGLAERRLVVGGAAGAGRDRRRAERAGHLDRLAREVAAGADRLDRAVGRGDGGAQVGQIGRGRDVRRHAVDGAELDRPVAGRGDALERGLEPVAAVENGATAQLQPYLPPRLSTLDPSQELVELTLTVPG